MVGHEQQLDALAEGGARGLGCGEDVGREGHGVLPTVSFAPHVQAHFCSAMINLPSVLTQRMATPSIWPLQNRHRLRLGTQDMRMLRCGPLSSSISAALALTSAAPALLPSAPAPWRVHRVKRESSMYA